MGIFRFLLAVGVLIYHSTPAFGISPLGGTDAIKAFYVISGFYMALVLNEKYKNIENSYFKFISNRFLRIYPTYYVILIATIALQVVLYFALHYKTESGIFAYWFNSNALSASNLFTVILTNITIVGQSILFFFGICPDGYSFCLVQNYDVGIHNYIFIVQAWTVGLEFLFYIIAPFIVTRPIKQILMVFASSVLCRMAFYFSGFYFEAVKHNLLINEIAFFMLGTLAYHLYCYLRTKKISSIMQYSCMTLILILTVFYEKFEYLAEFRIHIYVFILAVSIPFMFVLTKNNKYDRYIGELSYPIYISHMLVLMLTRSTYFPKIEGLGFTTVLVTTAFAILLHELLVKPIENYRQQRVK